VLDVGCGSKPYEPILRPYASRYIGLDVPDQAEGSGAAVYGDAQDLPFKDRAFGAVILTQVLEHLPEPARALREVSRVLQPEGALILSVPMMNVVHEKPRDYFRFTPYGVEYLLQRAGFTIKVIQNTGGFWAMIGQNINWRLGHVWHTRPWLNRLWIALSSWVTVPFFLLDMLDTRAAFDESINYVVVAQREVDLPRGAAGETQAR